MTALNTLLAKYDTPGPRYTSYPTVPFWEGGVTEAIWIKHLVSCLAENTSPQSSSEQRSNSDQQSSTEPHGFGIYVHIPFCEKLCAYCACHTFPTKDHKKSIPYVAALLKEWELYRRHLAPFNLTLGELHLGGGTPTFLSPNELSTLCEALLSGISVPPNARLSVEVDPRVTSPEHLRILSSYGFNRLSIGVQDFAPEVQRAVNRIQEPALVARQVELARGLGFSGINFDLIYGLPRQTTTSFARTIREVIELQPDRLALYSYAHVPWMKRAQARWREEDLPRGAEKWALYLTAPKALLEHGYIEIGMDHFALPHDPLARAAAGKTLHRNFMGYTESFTAPLIGLGISAISDALTCFAQNTKDLDEYYTRLAADQLPLHRGHLLSDEDLLIRKAILNLMTRLETELGEEVNDYLPLISLLASPQNSVLKDSGSKAIVPEQAATSLSEMIADGLVCFEKSECFERGIFERGREERELVAGIESESKDSNRVKGARGDQPSKGGRVTKLRILSAGKPFIRNVCMALDQRLQESKKQGVERVFSRTV